MVKNLVYLFESPLVGSTPTFIAKLLGMTLAELLELDLSDEEFEALLAQIIKGGK